ncbi:hypothetical protein Tco_1185448 [Tanacetum coccineum]
MKEPDTPPSPTHGTPFTKTTLSTQRSPTASGALYVESWFLHLDSLSLMVDRTATILMGRTMPNTRSGASRTREGANEQSDRRMAEALRVRDAVRNLGPLMGDEGEQEVNGNGGNRKYRKWKW